MKFIKKLKNFFTNLKRHWHLLWNKNDDDIMWNLSFLADSLLFYQSTNSESLYEAQSINITKALGFIYNILEDEYEGTSDEINAQRHKDWNALWFIIKGTKTKGTGMLNWQV